MTVNTSVDDGGVVGPDRVRAVVQGVLRAAQATWTDEALAEASGVKARTIKSYRVEGKEPSLSNALSLAVVIGPRALNPVLALIGYVAKPLDEPDAMQPMQIAADAMAQLSVIASAAADGRIDHVEEPGVRAAADTLIATVLPLASAGRAE